MQNLLAKLLLLLITVALVVPESYAKRVGGGRSFGRQSQITRQQRAPAPPAQRQQPAATPQPGPAVQPGMAGQAPAAPAQQIRRQASSPWGGLLGGALLGLGLGSLISDEHNADAANQSVGAGEDGATAASGNTQADATQAGVGPEPNNLGKIFLLAVAALIVYMGVRRRRARSRG